MSKFQRETSQTLDLQAHLASVSSEDDGGQNGRRRREAELE